MTESTNPSGVELSVTEAAQALLIDPRVNETPEEEKLEQENPEQETEQVSDELKAEDETLDGDDADAEREEDSSEEDNLEGGDSTIGDDEPFYTVKIDGEESEVNVPELIAGYQRQQDYTKKTTEVSEQRKEVEQLKAELSEARREYLQFTEALAAEAASELSDFEKIDWDSLEENDPVGYVRKQIEQQKAEKKIQDIRDKAGRAMAEQQTVDSEQMEAYISKQNQILTERLDGWADPDKSSEIKNGIVTFAQENGYTPQEISQFVNARDLIIMNKARMYDEIQAAKSKIKTKQTTPKVKPKVQSSTPKSDASKRSDKQTALKAKALSSGKPRDAQKAMAALFTGTDK